MPYATHTLLPEVRTTGPELFAVLGIPWHAGVGDGPSNHLLSSQVQCVNALGQMVADPSRLMLAFGDLLGIEEVLQIEPGRYLTFEYIGPQDFFNEVPGGERTRGARCTSVDAAFLHRARDGKVELVLVEWKYTESYSRRAANAGDATRRSRYWAALSADGSPVRHDLVPFDALLSEPFYQLTRQQLLARAQERVRAEGADRVRVVHVAPEANQAYWASVHPVELKALGDDVATVWGTLLRPGALVTSLDNQVFADADVTSGEYVLRYSDRVVHDLHGLLSLTDVPDPGVTVEPGQMADLAEEVLTGWSSRGGRSWRTAVSSWSLTTSERFCRTRSTLLSSMSSPMSSATATGSGSALARQRA